MGHETLDAIAALTHELAALRQVLEAHEPTASKLIAELENAPELAATLRDALNRTDPEQLLTAQQAAERWNVHPYTVDRWCRDGRVPAARKIGRGWLIPADATVEPTEYQAGRRARKAHRPTKYPPVSRQRASSEIDAAGQAVLDALKPKKSGPKG
jgi:excisionase family DNA binding protein